MARIRSLKPEAFQSETLAQVSLAAERTFLGLSTQVDDRGRIADKPASINGVLWAERSEREPHTAADLDAELKELEAVGAICRYVGCDGRRYLHLVAWDAHQRVDKPSKPRTPRCPWHQPAPDECGKHGKEPCPEPAPRDPSGNPRELSWSPREGSRALESHETDANQATGVEAAHIDRQDDAGEPIATVLHLHTPSDLESLANPREDSRVLPEGSMTYDPELGNKDLPASSADADASEEQGTLLAAREHPKPKRKSRAKKPNRTEFDDQADVLTNGYWERYKHTTAQSWIAVRQVTLQALKNGTDRNDLAFALDLIGREGNPVTANILTIALKHVRDNRNGGRPLAATGTDGRYAPGSGAFIAPNIRYSDDPKDVFG